MSDRRPPDPYPGYVREWTYDAKGNPVSYVDRFDVVGTGGCLLSVLMLFVGMRFKNKGGL